MARSCSGREYVYANKHIEPLHDLTMEYILHLLYDFLKEKYHGPDQSEYY